MALAYVCVTLRSLLKIGIGERHDLVLPHTGATDSQTKRLNCSKRGGHALVFIHLNLSIHSVTSKVDTWVPVWPLPAKQRGWRNLLTFHSKCVPRPLVRVLEFRLGNNLFLLLLAWGHRVHPPWIQQPGVWHPPPEQHARWTKHRVEPPSSAAKRYPIGQVLVLGDQKRKAFLRL